MITKPAQLELTPNATTLLKERCLIRDENGDLLETVPQLFQRVARHLASAEEAYGEGDQAVCSSFAKLMSSLDFLPNSPTLINAGTSVDQLLSSFVLPAGDSLETIFKAVRDAARIQATGGGVGFDLSGVRSKRDMMRSTKGLSPGPLAFLDVFDAVTECTKRYGRHRGANIVVLRIDHPDIEDFITLKRDPTRLTNMNLSVDITDDFMETLTRDDHFCLIDPRTNEVVKTLRARDLFNQIIEMAWETGDPGALFLDRVDRDNPTPHLGDIGSVSPCGEVPLLPYEGCMLGSVNLSHMVVNGQIDWAKLAETVRVGIRLLDAAIDINEYPLPETEERTLGNRKVGLGVMGWADTLVKLQIPYDSEEGVIAAEEMMEFISFHAKLASIQLARKRRPFPEFKKRSIYDLALKCLGYKKQSSRIVFRERPALNWQALVSQLETHGIRNATVTAISPTGSISTIAGVSSGIEPYFALAYVRHILGQQTHEVNGLFLEITKRMGIDNTVLLQEVVETGSVREIKTVPACVRRLFGTAHEIDPEWHVRMQAAFQKYVDNGISKTVNLRTCASKREVGDVYLLAHRLGCKGITVYRDGSKNRQVLAGGIGKRSGVFQDPQIGI